MDAVAALNEIAFWLERGRAATFKVQAFRKAAGIIAGLDPSEVAARARDGRLKSMKGIGDRTYQVIRQAVDGEVPEYLEDLRQRGVAPLADGGAELHAALRGDLHSHSDWSDGGSPIQLMADAARLLGREYLALTDHSPNLTIANGLSVERLTEQLDVVATINTASAVDGKKDGFRLLAGIEVDILESGELDQSPDMLDRLDIVVASVHSKLRSDRATMTKRMLQGIRNPQTNVLGHCTGRLVEGSRGTRPQSDFDAREVFAACADHNVAVEINARPERQDPPDDLIQLALDAGCLFSIDSDA
ncbi:MAG TPA: PHP domain-containing protein, partial [Arthrobacter bacterium]|nr:PHP domain-containing protein [Arthrobacter sp.]